MLGVGAWGSGDAPFPGEEPWKTAVMQDRRVVLREAASSCWHRAPTVPGLLPPSQAPLMGH